MMKLLVRHAIVHNSVHIFKATEKYFKPLLHEVYGYGLLNIVATSHPTHPSFSLQHMFFVV